jgi:prepilin-type N-terminal cleavage/methylation domain-containing protein
MILKKMRGFTLIELLIVVAIIGILAVLLVPNAITAIQKSKQKSSMKSITTIGTAIADYITDNGQAPDSPAGNTIDAGDAFYDALSPFYVRVIPEYDEWGERFHVWCNATDVNGNYGISGGLAGDFLVVSYGRDNTVEGWTFDENDPETGRFVINEMSDFNFDLVAFSGSWIRAPKSGGVGGT